MAGIKRFRYSFEPRGASVLDRPTVPGHASTGRAYIVKTWDIPRTVGSSGRRRHARKSTGNTSVSVQNSAPTTPPKDLTDRFLRLSTEWKRDTGHLSLVSQIVAHSSYQSIIAMGESAIPFILRDLEKEPNHWFSALSAIADEGPEIPVHERGDIRAISEAWIKWGRLRNILNEHATRILVAPPSG